MNNYFSRTASLIGESNLNKLENFHVAVFGVGGVGGYVIEALVRSGLGEITIIDNDVVSETNINRQIIATVDSIGLPKTEVMKKRILSINPDCKVHCINAFILETNRDQFDFSGYNYVVDAIDTISGKIAIILNAKEKDIPVISSMGTGNKLHPNMFEIVDINQTSVCPLAKVMRYELKKRNIKGVKVLYSKEMPIKADESLIQEESSKRAIPGSIAFVPSSAGLLIAAEVINDIINSKNNAK